MKEEQIYDGITNIREDLIEWAGNYEFRKTGEKQTGNRKLLWITLASAAACLMLIFATPLLLFATRRCGSDAPVGTTCEDGTPHGSVRPGDNAPESVMNKKMVWIYYVNAGDISIDQHYVKLQAAEVFEVWKEKNGIGDEVLLLGCESRSDVTIEQPGVTVTQVPGEYRCLYLTVSKNLESYYNVVDSELLLESLKQTMTGYSGVEYPEYHLILE